MSLPIRNLVLWTPSNAICAVVRLPNELVLEVLSYFRDPHRKILRARGGPFPWLNLDPKYVERLTITRRLTMTCWHLRNKLFPILWKYVEGCNFAPRHPASKTRYTPVPPKNGLYSQCSYLLLNPSVGVYVQCVDLRILLPVSRTLVIVFYRFISVDLRFEGAPRGLTTKFLNCLAQLPNLRTMEAFGTGGATSVIRGFERNPVQFPGVCELVIGDDTAEFIGRCPNVETIISPRPLSSIGATILNSEGRKLKKLKRVVGVAEDSVQLGELDDTSELGVPAYRRHDMQVTQGCPDLQEIGISDSTLIRNVVTVNPSNFVIRAPRAHSSLFSRLTSMLPTTCDR